MSCRRQAAGQVRRARAAPSGPSIAIPQRPGPPTGPAHCFCVSTFKRVPCPQRGHSAVASRPH
eukprot:6003996-Alexandrium_andersonii.AAC.1